MSSEKVDIELRPLNLGEILDRTAQLYRTHFLLFVGIAVLPRALSLVFQLVQIAVSRYLAKGGATPVAFTIGAAVIGLLLYFVFVGLGLAATNRAVSSVYLGEPTSVVDSYRQVKPHWLRYLGIMLLSSLYAWGPMLVPYAIFFSVVGLDGKKFVPGAVNATVLGLFALMGLGFLLAVPYGTWMTLRYSMAVPASIFEGIGVRAAMKRSVSLTRKGRGRIFVMLLLVGIVFWIVAVAAEMPFMISAIRAAKNHQQPPVISLVYSQFVSFVLYSIIGPVYGVAITLFYYDERIRKEGFDIEWMMVRAQLSGTAPPPVPLVELPLVELPPEGPQGLE